MFVAEDLMFEINDVNVYRYIWFWRIAGSLWRRGERMDIDERGPDK